MTGNGYRLSPVTDGDPVKGGLSYANGSCVMVTRLTDGGYTLSDSKLGTGSPVWTLSADQFRRLGALLIRLPVWAGTERAAEIGGCGGPVFTVRRTYPGYVFSLTGESDLTFTGNEVLAFTWGFMYDQWPTGEPVRRLEFT